MFLDEFLILCVPRCGPLPRFSSFLVSPRDHCELQEPDHKPRGRARLGDLDRGFHNENMVSYGHGYWLIILINSG